MVISLLQNGHGYFFSFSSFLFDSKVVTSFSISAIACSPISFLISRVFIFSPQLEQNLEFSSSLVLHFSHFIKDCAMEGLYKFCRSTVG